MDARIEVPKFRSESTKVRAIERDGIAKMIRTELTRMVQTKRGMFQYSTPFARCLRIVTMKLTEPRMLEMVRMWRPRIQRSIPFPGASTESGTYPVHPALALERMMRIPAGQSIQ